MTDATSDQHHTKQAERKAIDALEELWREGRTLNDLEDEVRSHERAFLCNPSKQQLIHVLNQARGHNKRARTPPDTTQWYKIHEEDFRKARHILLRIHPEEEAKHLQEHYHNHQRRGEQFLAFYDKLALRDHLQLTMTDWVRYITQVPPPPDPYNSNTRLLAYGHLVSAKARRGQQAILEELTEDQRRTLTSTELTTRELAKILNNTGHHHYFGGRR